MVKEESLIGSRCSKTTFGSSLRSGGDASPPEPKMEQVPKKIKRTPENKKPILSKI